MDNNEEKRFKAFQQSNYRVVFLKTLKILANAHLADDVTAETFHKTYMCFIADHEKRLHKTLLYRIWERVLVSHFRSESRRRQRESVWFERMPFEILSGGEAVDRRDSEGRVEAANMLVALRRHFNDKPSGSRTREMFNAMLLEEGGEGTRTRNICETKEATYTLQTRVRAECREFCDSQ